MIAGKELTSDCNSIWKSYGAGMHSARKNNPQRRISSGRDAFSSGK